MTQYSPSATHQYNTFHLPPPTTNNTRFCKERTTPARRALTTHTTQQDSVTHVTNFDKKDAFEEAFTSAGLQVDKVHIRVQQRNRKKCVVSIQGLADDLDLHRILKALKRAFQCNGAIVKDADWGEIIQLQGDHRAGIVDFLVSEQIVPKELIVVHGF